MNFHFSKILRYENAYDCHPMSIPSVSAVLFGFHGINMLKNFISWELLRILEDFHFSISKHFDFTFYFLRKNESILISLGTSQKRVKAFFFTLQFSKKSESFLFSLFTSRISKTHSRWSLRGAGIINTYNLLSVGKPLLLWPDQLSGCFGDSFNGCTLDDSVVYLGCSTNQLVVQLE